MAWTLGGFVGLALLTGACGGATGEPLAGRSDRPLPPAPTARDAPMQASTSSTPLPEPVSLDERLRDADPATTRELSLAGVELTSLEAIGAYVHLEDLDVSRTGVRDIAALARMPELQRLDLSRTEVRDIRVLGELRHLRWLNLQLCDELPAEAFEVLREVPGLRYVDVLGTRLGSLAVFEGLTELTTIAIDFTPVSDLLSFASGPAPGARPSALESRAHAKEAQRKGIEAQRQYASLERLRARGVAVEIDCMCEDLRPSD